MYRPAPSSLHILFLDSVSVSPTDSNYVDIRSYARGGRRSIVEPRPSRSKIGSLSTSAPRPCIIVVGYHTKVVLRRPPPIFKSKKEMKGKKKNKSHCQPPKGSRTCKPKFRPRYHSLNQHSMKMPIFKAPSILCAAISSSAAMPGSLHCESMVGPFSPLATTP